MVAHILTEPQPPATPEEIITAIRATDYWGKPVLSDREAVLMLTLYASVKVEQAKQQIGLRRVEPFPPAAAYGI